MKQEIFEQLLRENNTPAYIFDIDKLEKKAIQLRELFGTNSKTELCYAIKANPFVAKKLEPYIDKFEVCSPGELSICMHEKIDMQKIVLSGVNKEKKDILTALEQGVSIYTVESVSQLELLRQCAVETERSMKVLLRLTSGNQFGMDREDIIEIIEKRSELSGIEIEGIQYYSGTQKKEKAIFEAAEMLHDFCRKLEEQYHFKVRIVEYGPGFKIDYWGKDKENLQENVIEEYKKLLEPIAEWQTVIEMGRFLAAECGSYLTKVVDVKRNEERNYCIIDGGINHLNYYGQVMGVRVPPLKYYRLENDMYTEMPVLAAEGEKFSICGSLCTSADVLVQEIAVEGNIRTGDLFVFEKTGAYSVTEGIYLFLSRRLPAVYFLKDDKLELVRAPYESFQLNCSTVNSNIL